LILLVIRLESSKRITINTYFVQNKRSSTSNLLRYSREPFDLDRVLSDGLNLRKRNFIKEEIVKLNNTNKTSLGEVSQLPQSISIYYYYNKQGYYITKYLKVKYYIY